MIDGALNVNHGALDGAAQGLVASARRISARLDGLEQDLAPLREQWTGVAKNAYDQARARWDAAMAEMTQLLEQVGRTVDQSNQQYRAADQRGAGRFGG